MTISSEEAFEKLKRDFEDYMETEVKPKIEIQDAYINFSQLYYIGCRQANDDFQALAKIIKEGAFLQNPAAWTTVGSSTTVRESQDETIEIDRPNTKVKDNFFIKRDRLLSTFHH